MKLEENLPCSFSQLLVAAGHDVDTVVDEELAGASDPQVVAVAILVLRLPERSAPTVAGALVELIAARGQRIQAGMIGTAQRGPLRIRRLQEGRERGRPGPAGIWPASAARPASTNVVASPPHRAGTTSSAMSPLRWPGVTPRHLSAFSVRAGGVDRGSDTGMSPGPKDGGEHTGQFAQVKL